MHCVKELQWMIKGLNSTPHFNLNVLSVAFVVSLLVFLAAIGFTLYAQCHNYTILRVFFPPLLLRCHTLIEKSKWTRMYNKTLCAHENIMRKAFELTFRGAN